MNNKEVIEKIKHQLIVSCQALEGEVLYAEKGGIMPLMALAAKKAGASAIRCNSIRDIKQIKEKVDLPLIGIIKADYDDSPVYITPTMKEVDELVESGVEIIALDFTNRLRPNMIDNITFFKQIKEKYPNKLLMADISNYDEAKLASELGFDFVGTTLNGYCGDEKTDGPNFSLVEKIVKNLNCRCIAEGRIYYPHQARKLLDIGAYCVVVGGAITRPYEIACRFIEEIKK